MIGQLLRTFERRVPFRRFIEDRSGAPALEFALIAPTLFLVIMGGIESSRLLWTQSALEMSVAQAARCYAWQVSGCTTTSGVKTFAASVAPQLNFSTSVFTATNPAPSTSCSCGATQCAEVSASYPYTFIAQGLLPMTPTLQASACFPAVS
jgi:Flp pilus assembly protein TadG